MMILTDEKISLMAHNEDEGDWNDLRFKDAWHEGYKAGAKAAQAAVIAKLASAELPEPAGTIEVPSPVNYGHGTHTVDHVPAFTADQLRQAYAQGAAAQLSAEPVAHLRKNGFRFLGDFEPQDDSELPLYTRRQA